MIWRAEHQALAADFHQQQALARPERQGFEQLEVAPPDHPAEFQPLRAIGERLVLGLAGGRLERLHVQAEPGVFSTTLAAATPGPTADPQEVAP